MIVTLQELEPGFIVGLLLYILFRETRYRIAIVQFKKMKRLLESMSTTNRHTFLPYIRAINVTRSLHWHPTGTKEWRTSQWSNAAAGEMGECCNWVKKLERIREGLKWSNNVTEAEAVEKIKFEIGDTILYLDLLADNLGLTTEECIRDTFNRVSYREKFTERL